MKLIVGLGNPGPQYADTRHNAGYAVVVRLAERHHIRVNLAAHQSLIGRGKIHGEEVYLQQPVTYMNLSGTAVAAAVRAWGLAIPDILVISDDLDLPLGTIRLRGSGGSGGQKGLGHIITCLGTEDFARLRIGIGRPPAGTAIEDYVLSKWTSAEKEIFDQAVDVAADAAESFIRHGVEETANRYNRRSE